MAKKKNNSTKAPAKFTYNKFWCIWNIVEATVILAAGIISIIFSTQKVDDGKVVSNVLPFIVGGFIAMDAVLRIIATLSNHAKDSEQSVMLVGGFELTAAILVMIFHNDFTRLIVYALAILLIVIGGLLALFSIYAMIKKSKKYFMPILETIFAAVLVAVGVVVLVLYSQNDNNQIVLIVMGIVFCVVGIGQFASTMVTMNKAKKENKGAVVPTDNKKEEKKPEPKQEEGEKVIDAEIVEKDEEVKAIENKSENE